MHLYSSNYEHPDDSLTFASPRASGARGADALAPPLAAVTAAEASGNHDGDQEMPCQEGGDSPKTAWAQVRGQTKRVQLCAVCHKSVSRVRGPHARPASRGGWCKGCGPEPPPPRKQLGTGGLPCVYTKCTSPLLMSAPIQCRVPGIRLSMRSASIQVLYPGIRSRRVAPTMPAPWQASPTINRP